MTVDTTKITVRKALYDNISQIHKDHFNIQSNCYHSEHKAASMYIVLIKCMVSWYFYSLHIKHKKIQVKNLKRDVSRLWERYQKCLSLLIVISIPLQWDIRVKAHTLFCANSSGEVFSTPVLKENPKAKHHSRTSLVILFFKSFK